MVPDPFFLRHAVAGPLLLAVRRDRRNRVAYGSQPGLRILAVHAEDTDDFDRFRRFVEWCGAQYPLLGPEAADAPGALTRDALLLTIDDGHARTFRAMEWLASIGVRATYFVVPSYVGRSVREYLDFHAARGVAAFDLAGPHDPATCRGFEPSQLREVEAMGHRIGAHNHAHRNLRRITAAEAEYEIVEAGRVLADHLQHPVRDFAWAFGRVDSVTPAALALMRERYARVYSCVRGLNVAGITPAVLLRDPVSVWYPRAFRAACVRGAVDHRYVTARAHLARLAGRLPRLA